MIYQQLPANAITVFSYTLAHNGLMVHTVMGMYH